MQTTPILRAARIAQLKPGELFVCASRNERWVALVAEDDTQNEPEKLVLPIGPVLPQYMTYPTLMRNFGFTLTSYGRDFCLRWPTEPEAWSEEEPPAAVVAMVLADNAAFLRCNFSPQQNHFQACFVDLATGKICSEGNGPSGRYIRPPGTRAFAARWELLTLERPPRTILAYPFGPDSDG